jgi:hypothetical protein
MPSGKKPPADPAKAAKSILDQVTRENPKAEPKNPAAQTLGALGGRRRVEALSAEDRHRIAAAAARKRWSDKK